MGKGVCESWGIRLGWGCGMTIPWLGGKPIYQNGLQVCEVLRSQGFVIRNLQPNGTVGVCYTTKVAEDIHSWLDENYPGWTQ